MRLVWDHTFYDCLGIDPQACNVLLTDPPLNPSANRQRMLDTVFETYGFQGAFVQVRRRPLCSCFGWRAAWLVQIWRAGWGWGFGCSSPFGSTFKARKQPACCWLALVALSI